ncbi:MAG: SDR family NAD(P)-dependent oxidoreductase [Deltaproteobacteria bacterium]|nr:SDR family NAD(P)-dependent oxidoreductase [Deltaproteobacteria bacterium]
MLSPRGRCAPFDAEADGIAPAEGVGAFVLKDLEAALRDGDPIRAVLVADGINHDGKTNGLVAPSGPAQTALIRQVYGRFGVSPGSIGAIEAHGTGTALGDPIEVHALAEVYAGLPAASVALGSVKANIGHALEAAGVAAVARAILSVSAGELYKNPHFCVENPRIGLAESPFWVPTTTQTWTSALPRRVGVSAFGMNGTNVHLVVEEPPRRPARASTPRAELIVLSARSETALRTKASQLADWLEREGRETPLTDVAATLLLGRKAMDLRAFWVGQDRAALVAWLRSPNLSARRASASGQGAVVHPHGAREDVLRSRGEAWLQGEALDVAALDGATWRKVHLPTYPFEGRPYRLDAPAEAPSGPVVPPVDPLAELVQTLTTPSLGQHVLTLTGQETTLRDHQILGQAVLPGVATLAVAVRAAIKDGVLVGSVRGVSWTTPWRGGDGPIELRFGGGGRFEANAGGTLRASGRVGPAPSTWPDRLDLSAAKNKLGGPIDGETMYARFAETGWVYGPTMRPLQRLWHGLDAAVAELRGLGGALDLGLMDGCIQALNGLLLHVPEESRLRYLPFGVEEVAWRGPLPAQVTAVVRRRSAPEGSLRADVLLAGPEGEVVMVWTGVELRALERRASAAEVLSLSRSWAAEPAPGPAPEGPVLVVGGPPAVVSALLSRLGPQARAASLESLDNTLSRGPRPRTVLWLLEGGPVDPRDLSAEVKATGEAVLGMFARLAAHGAAPVRCVAATLGAAASPRASALPAIGRVAGLERPGWGLRLVTGLPAGIAAVEGLLAELGGVGSGELRWSMGQRQVARPSFVPYEAPESRWVAQPGMVVLVTGAAGRLAGHVLAWLTQTPGLRLALVSRDGVSNTTLAALQTAGAEVLQLRADLSERAQVHGAVMTTRRRFGAVHAVFHLAGASGDARLEALGDPSPILGPKVQGAVWLDEALAGEPIERFVLFSSLAAELPGPGQAAYAYANAALNAFAEARQAAVDRGDPNRRGRTLSVGWPLWADGGMRLDAEGLRRLHRALGAVPLTTEAGIELLSAALAGPGGALTLLLGDADRAREGLALVENGAAPVIPAPVIPSTSTSEVEAADPAEVQAVLVLALAELLEMSPDEVALDGPWDELGIDSITYVRLANRLSEALEIEVLPSAFFEHRRPLELAAQLAQRVPKRVSPPQTPPPPPSPPAAPLSTPPSDLGQTLAAALGVPVEAVDLESEWAELGVEGALLHGVLDWVQAQTGARQTAAWLLDHRSPAQVLTAIGARLAPRPAPAPAPPRAARRAQQAPEREPIAILGMSGAMPGSPDLPSFWANLHAGRHLVSEVPADRWDWRALQGVVGEPGRTDVRWGGFMSAIDSFDPAYFGISPNEARRMDPQQRLVLLHTWDALADAGLPPQSLAGRDVSVHVGVSATDYQALAWRHALSEDPQLATGTAHSVLVNRVSFLLDVHGPSEPVDTACSSSLVALHRAAEGLWRGEVELALAGGVNALLTPDLFVGFRRAGMLSPTGACRAFGAEADGYVRGEGVGMVVLKPLSRALADGDPVRALILATGVNHGGRANSLTAPNPAAQRALIIETWRRAGVDARTIGLWEAHGTGTRLGDPVEIGAVTAALEALTGERATNNTPPRTWLGSVKSNIGHLESASGVAGLLKVVLAMEHRRLPATLHVETPNPMLRLEGTPLALSREARPWARPVDQRGAEQPRRAALSSFGFGGANAHVALEEAPRANAAVRARGCSP